MSERVGPMAWGQQGTVFLGEDLMHSRDYSEDTSRVVDEEVSRILREQEARARTVLSEHRAGLDGVARMLLEKETVDGAQVARIIDDAYGRPVHGVDSEVEHYARGISEQIALSGEAVSAGAAGDTQPSGMAAGALKPTDPLDPLA